MKNIYLPITILFSLTLFGCGGSSSESSNETDDYQNKSQISEVEIIDSSSLGLSDLDPLLLEGFWSQGCVVNGNRSFQNQLTYEGSKVRIQSDMYSDSLCEVPFSRSQTLASFEFGEESETLSGEAVNKIKYTVDSVVIYFFEAEVISNFNKEQLCGAIDWQINSSKDISGCDAFKSLWNIEKDIFMLNNEGLFAGDLSTLGDDNFPNLLDDNTFSYREIGTITGVWEKSCTTEFENNAKITSISFSNENVVRSTDYYSDASCQILRYGIEELGTYTVGEEITLASGIVVNELEIQLNSIILTVYETFILDFLNNNEECSTETWIAGEPKEVINCALLGINSEQKDIFNIEGNNINFGVKEGQEQGEFPEQLETTYFLRQQ
jgi:hypothetical protein